MNQKTKRFILTLFAFAVGIAGSYCVTRALRVEREYRACIQDDDSSHLADIASGCERFVLIEFTDVAPECHVSRPEAKGDLVIVHRYEEGSLGVTVTIQTTTDEAEAWLTANAPKFGYLEKLDGPGRYLLSIQPEVYNVDWVLAWLEQMGE